MERPKRPPGCLPFVGRSGGGQCALRVDADEGGAQHCQRDYLTLVCTTIADWLMEKL